MLEEKKPGSVWNVALMAIGLFLAVIVIHGIITPAEIAAVAVK